MFCMRRVLTGHPVREAKTASPGPWALTARLVRMAGRVLLAVLDHRARTEGPARLVSPGLQVLAGTLAPTASRGRAVTTGKTAKRNTTTTIPSTNTVTAVRVTVATVTVAISPVQLGP